MVTVGRASSATVYGYSSAIDQSRVNARRGRYAYGLRSASSPDGFYSGGTTTRKRKPTVVDALGYVVPVAGVDDDETVVRPLRNVSVAPVRDRIDYAAERHLAGSVRMGDMD